MLIAMQIYLGLSMPYFWVLKVAFTLRILYKFLEHASRFDRNEYKTDTQKLLVVSLSLCDLVLLATIHITGNGIDEDSLLSSITSSSSIYVGSLVIAHVLTLRQ